MALRELFVKIQADTTNTEEQLKRVSKEVDKAKQEFDKLGVSGQASYSELAKAVGISSDQMEKLIQKTKQEIKLDEQFRSAARSAGLTDVEINKIKNSIDKVKESTASWKNVMSGLAAVGVTAFAGMFAKQGIELAAQSEDMAIQFEVLMGSAEKANATLETLRTFTKKTPFNSDQVIKAGRQLLAVNFQAEELTHTLRMIGDVSKGTGKDFNELATIFAKNKSSNFIQGEDLNQLIEAGIPILDEFSKMFGKTAIQVKEMGSKNQIEFKHLQKAFENMTSEGGKYSGMMQKLSMTSLGLYSQIADEFMAIAKDFGKAILDVAKPVLEFFGNTERGSTRIRLAVGLLSFAIGTVLVMASKSAMLAGYAMLVPYLPIIKTVAAISAGLMALYLVLEDIYVFLEYGHENSETFFGDFLRWIGFTNEDMQKMSQVFLEFKNILSEAGKKFMEFVNSETGQKIIEIGKTIFKVAMGIALLPAILVGAVVSLPILIIAKWEWLKEKLYLGWIWLVSVLKKSAIVLGKILLISIFPLSALYLFRNEILSIFNFLLNYIKSLPFVQKFIEQFLNLKERIANIFSSMWQSLKATFSSLLPVDTINAVIDAINWISQKLNEFSSGSIAQRLGITPLNLPIIPHIQARALGGPIEANMPYLVGERGPEIIIPNNNGTVIPNERLQTLNPNTNNYYSFTIHINSTSPEYDAQSLYEKFLELVNSEASRSKQRYEMGLL